MSTFDSGGYDELVAQRIKERANRKWLLDPSLVKELVSRLEAALDQIEEYSENQVIKGKNATYDLEATRDYITSVKRLCP